MKFVICLVASLAVIHAADPASPDQTSPSVAYPPYSPLPLCCPPCPQSTCSREQSTEPPPPELQRELFPGQQGSIQVRCDGGLTLQFFLEYKIRNQRIRTESGQFTHTMKKTLDIPAEAEDITVTLQRVLGAATSDILTRQWKYPVIRCYSSTDGITAKKVGCS